VGALVELVAHPLAYARRQQQPLGPADQIVEIDQPPGALGLAIAARERLAGAKAGGEPRQHAGKRAHRDEAGAAFEGCLCELGVIGILWSLPLAETAQLAVATRPDRVERREQPGTLFRP